MERLFFSSKISYGDFLSMGKDVYLYPGRFNEFFASPAFLKELFEDKERYAQYLALKNENPIPDVFLFKMSYILNPYMSLRYHKFIFSSYEELGTTMLSYGPVVDVYLKDLLIYHLLSSYMVRLRDDARFPEAYKAVKEEEKEAEEDENLAYWTLAFRLAKSKTLIYDKKEFADPKAFFEYKLDISDLLSFASSFLSSREVLAWLKLLGYGNKIAEFLALTDLADKKEEAAQEQLAKALYAKFIPSSSGEKES
jgi:hypothetical protein